MWSSEGKGEANHLRTDFAICLLSISPFLQVTGTFKVPVTSGCKDNVHGKTVG